MADEQQKPTMNVVAIAYSTEICAVLKPFDDFRQCFFFGIYLRVCLTLAVAAR